MNTPAEERQVARRVAEQIKTQDEQMEVDPHPDRTREFRTPGFARMRLNWSGDDGAVIQGVIDTVDRILMEKFPVAYEVMYEIFNVVREAEIDPATGRPRKDHLGLVVWKQNSSGTYVEDWGKLTDRLRENSLHKITLYLIEWEEHKENLWGEAMFAKAAWEERFAGGFLNAPGTKPTVDAATSYGRAASMEERYFAIFKTLVSRRADALTRSMERLGQRLKDTTIR
jgi:hypothetical protein